MMQKKGEEGVERLVNGTEAGESGKNGSPGLPRQTIGIKGEYNYKCTACFVLYMDIYLNCSRQTHFLGENDTFLC